MCSELSELAALTREWAVPKKEIRAVLLFGSRARGEANRDSDWDICVVVDASGDSGWYGT